MNDFLETIALLEKDLGLEPNFLGKLVQEDDWSFVIKTHALVEAALSHLLAMAARDPRLIKVFQRLDTSDETTGKLAFVKAMKLLDEPQRKFVRQLSKLRNQLIHDVSNTGFKFDGFLAKMDTQQRKEFRQAFSWQVRPRPDAPKDDWNENVFKSPQLAIWLNLVILLSHAYEKKVRFLDLMDEEELRDNLG